jgi:hypothetical protein
VFFYPLTPPVSKLTAIRPLQEAVRNLHREAREAVEKGRSSDESYAPLRAEELDRLCGMTRLVQAEPPVPVIVPEHEHLASDYRALSGLDAPAASSAYASVDPYAPPDPQLVRQVAMVCSGISAPNTAFAGEEDFGVGQWGEDAFGAGIAAAHQPYILDASWHDFVAQLGF